MILSGAVWRGLMLQYGVGFVCCVAWVDRFDGVVLYFLCFIGSIPKGVFVWSIPNGVFGIECFCVLSRYF